MQKLTYRKRVVILILAFGATSILKIFILRSSNFFVSHLSNFALTGMLLSTSLLYFRKYNPRKARNEYLQALGVCVLLNLVLEFGKSIGNIKLPFGGTFESFNIADPIDGLFGLAAIVAVALVKKYWINKVIPIESSEDNLCKSA
jgi:hypothetical protein